MAISVTVTKKYLVLPVQHGVPAKKVLLLEGGTLLFDVDCMLAEGQPDFYAYLDVSRFMGKTLTLTAQPEVPFSVAESDTMELTGLWQEPYRPQVHFTVKNGWNNDPNGLIFYGGQYHMFFQYNPCAVEWGNMHWGHAVSRDLLHWEEQDITLYPDELGTMYSGSAIADTENVSGLGRDGVPPILLYYTAAGNHSRLSAGQPVTQCLAFSADGGVTFQKYAGNPILGYIAGGNRDPKVVFVEEIGLYIMALYLDADRFLLLSSRDLVHFEKYQELQIVGDLECPDLFPLCWEGEKYWVLLGGKSVYMIGRFSKTGFVAEWPATPLYYNASCHASQSVSGVPDGRIVRICWDTMQHRTSGARCSQQMGIPVEMHLETAGGRPYLCAQPIAELSSLYLDGDTAENGLILHTAPMTLCVGDHPADVFLRMPYAADTVLQLDLFGHTVVCDMTQNQLRFGDKVKMPLSAYGEVLTLRIVTDRCTSEIFADGGKFCTTLETPPRADQPRIVLSADRPICFERLTWHSLRSIH